jgi:hypothetical protein
MYFQYSLFIFVHFFSTILVFAWHLLLVPCQPLSGLFLPFLCISSFYFYFLSLYVLLNFPYINLFSHIFILCIMFCVHFPAMLLKSQLLPFATVLCLTTHRLYSVPLVLYITHHFHVWLTHQPDVGAVNSSEMVSIYQITQCNILEGSHLIPHIE